MEATKKLLVFILMCFMKLSSKATWDCSLPSKYTKGPPLCQPFFQGDCGVSGGFSWGLSFFLKPSDWNLTWIAIQVQVGIERIEMHIRSHSTMAQHQDTLHQTWRQETPSVLEASSPPPLAKKIENINTKWIFPLLCGITCTMYSLQYAYMYMYI